jgi:hypothetical protein
VVSTLHNGIVIPLTQTIDLKFEKSGRETRKFENPEMGRET